MRADIHQKALRHDLLPNQLLLSFRIFFILHFFPMVHFHAHWITSFQWTRHISAIKSGISFFFFFYFFGTLFGVQMILKHLRGLGLFTSAHIKFYDAVCSNRFDDEGGKSQGWSEFTNGQNLAKNHDTTSLLSSCFYSTWFVMHRIFNCVYIIESEFIK